MQDLEHMLQSKPDRRDFLKITGLTLLGIVAGNTLTANASGTTKGQVYADRLAEIRKLAEEGEYDVVHREIRDLYNQIDADDLPNKSYFLRQVRLFHYERTIDAPIQYKVREMSDFERKLRSRRRHLPTWRRCMPYKKTPYSVPRRVFNKTPKYLRTWTNTEPHKEVVRTWPLSGKQIVTKRTYEEY